MLKRINNKRGSAIIMALVTITILLVLGMAVITLSMGTLTTNVADATTNDTYYAAEAGINSAIEQVKTEVVKYYAEMSKLDGNYTSLYDNFFQGIASNSSSNFNEPDIQSMDTITTFSAGNFDEGANTGDILISCEAIAADGTKYVVNGSVNVLRIDLRSGGGEWFFDGVALYAGDTLHVKQWYNGVTPYNATIVCNRYTPNNWTKAGGVNYNVVVDENAAGAIGEFLPYPSYSNPAVGSNVIEFAAGTSIPNASGISEGIIFGRGDLSLASWSTAYKDVYCDGNLSISGTNFIGNIYCRGNLTFTGGSFSGKIICDGNITISNCNKSGVIMSGGYINASGGANSCSFYAVGPINISGGNGSADGGVIYSCTELRISGSNAHGIYFSGGDIFANNGTSLDKSALIAKGTIHANGNWLTLSYDQSYIDSVKNNPANAFFFGGGSGGSGGGGAAPTSDVIQGQSITALGRLN